MARIILQSIVTFTALIFCLGFANGGFSRKLQAVKKIITVDKSNPSSFSTIQAAIDYVPSNNNNWIVIDLKPGNYKEKVKINEDKTFIHLKGEVGKTSITWGEGSSIFNSPTFDSWADNILITGITFVNTYNYPVGNGARNVMPAVAAKISGDKSALYDCTFLGYQDTLFDHDGRHYFKNCNITGAIDFIFGNGQSIYEGCTISMALGAHTKKFVGYITAQGRLDPSENSGFVFKSCNVNGDAKMYLGRAWRSYARVIFYDSIFSNIIVPRGWDSWKKDGNLLTFAEEECHGLGANKSNRVKWEKTLSQQELQSYVSISYIDKEGWISKLPSH